MADKKLRFEVEADTDGAVKDLAKLEDAAERLEKTDVDVKVGIDADQVAGQVADVRADLDRLASETAYPQVKVKVDDAALDNARRRIDDVGDSAVQSVGPLRDIGSALGGVGGGALDAAEGVLGFGEALATVNPKFERFFTVVSRFAFVGGGITLAVTALSKGFDALSKALTGADQAAKDLKGLQSAKATLEDFNKVVDDLENRRKGGGLVPLNFDALFGSRTDSRVKAFAKLLEDGLFVAAAQVNDELLRTGEISRRVFDEQASAINDAIAAQANLGAASRETAAAVEVRNRALELGIDLGAKSTDQLAAEVAAVERGEAARKRYRDQVQGSADATADAAAATADYRTALELLNDEIDRRSGAILSEAETRQALAEAQARYNEVVEDEASTVDDRVVAAQRVAEGFAAVLEAQKLANGESFTTADRNAAIVASLKSTADQAKGPTKDAILDVVDALEQVPPSVDTTMVVDNADALAKLNALIRKMEEVQAAARITAYIAANPGRPIGVLGVQQSVAPAVVQNITFNVGPGTDAFALQRQVLAAQRQTARLANGAARYTGGRR